MTFKTLLSTTLLFAVCTTAFALPSQTEQTTPGYAYTLHTATPSVKDLGQFPPQYKKPTTEHVLQGPVHTLIWRDRVSQRTVENASFALGEQHMGLYIPHWLQGKSASDATGWDEFGDKLTYTSFNVKVEPGEGQRDIAGGTAQHYVLTADFTRQLERDPSAVRNQMQSDLWIVSDKPFSWAPFHTSGAYSDPRFAAAAIAKLEKLGMVVRSDARYWSVAVDAGGQEVGTKHEGTWTTWIADLEPAAVPVVNMPTGDRATLQALQDGFRKQPDATCNAVMAGETPSFIAQDLKSEQQAAVIKDLRKSCKRQAMRTFSRNMKKDPQSVCGDILAGKVPGVVSQALNQDEQKEFIRDAVSFCEK